MIVVVTEGVAGSEVVDVSVVVVRFAVAVEAGSAFKVVRTVETSVSVQVCVETGET